MRFMVETDLKLSGCVSADTLAALRAEGYDYKDGNLVPAGKEETMQEKINRMLVTEASRQVVY